MKLLPEKKDYESCYYCGAIAGTIDHVPPRSIRPTLIHLGLSKRIPFIEVSACHECNTMLSDHSIWTLHKRKDFIKKRLRRRYHRALASPDWSDSELARQKKR